MKKIKVSYLGLNSLFGRVTTNLLKQSPCIHKLTLYDDGAPSHAIEHPNVFFGRDSLQDAIKDVNIVVIGDEGGEAKEEDHLKLIGPKVVRYTEAIIKFSPNAIVIVAASPLNILFPLIGSFLGPDWQDRLLGTTSVDTLRASRALDGLLSDPQGQAHILPVIGGTSYSTRVPLFSHVCPQITVSDDIRNKIIEKMKLFDCSDCQEMDAIERAYSTVRFIHSVLTGLTRDTSVPEIAMTKTSGVPQTSYFSLPILIGQKGIERAADLPKLDAKEEKLFFEAAQKLSEESQRAEAMCKQFTAQNEAEDLKKETAIKMQNTTFHEVEGKKLVDELQLKKTFKDPVPFRRVKTRKKQKFARKHFLGLPCVEAAPGSSSPGISEEPSKNAPRQAPFDISEAEEKTAKEPASEYSEILNKDVSEHLSSLNFSQAGISQKLNLLDENTDDEFSETLQCEVDDHLSSLKHSGQPNNLDGVSNNAEIKFCGIETEGKSNVEARSASDEFVMSSQDSNEGSGSSGTASTPSTPYKRMNNVIADSKPIKFRSSSAKTSEMTNTSIPPPKSPSIRTDSAIAASRMKAPANVNKFDLDSAKLEERDAKKELRPDNSFLEKPKTKLPAEARIDVRKDSKPPNNEMAENNRDGAHDESMMLIDAKKELRPRDPSVDGLGIKPETVSETDVKKELRPRNASASRAGVEPNSLATEDAKKELRPRDETGSPKSNQNVKKVGIKARVSKVRGKVNSQVLSAFEADRSSGDHMSKSQIMMLKRKQKTEEKFDKPQVGKDGDAAKAGGLGQANSTDNSAPKGKDKALNEPSKDSTAESSSVKQVSGRIGRRSVPLRKSTDKRRHRGKHKMVFSGGKWKTQEAEDEAIKESETKQDLAKPTSEAVKVVPNVPTNAAKRINSAITDVKVRIPKRGKESSNESPQYRPDEKPNPVPISPYANGSPTSKRIDTAISDTKRTRQRSPSPKPIDSSRKQPDVGSHLLTDAARVAKLNSIHKANSQEFNIEKTTETSNVRFEPDFKVDVSRKPQKGENKKQEGKPNSGTPKSQKSDKTLKTKDNGNDGNPYVTDKELTSDKTMNYFMHQRTKGPIDSNGFENTEAPVVKRLTPKKRQSRQNESKIDKRKKLRHPKDHNKNEDVSKIEQNSGHKLNNSKKPDQPGTRKDIIKKDNDREPEDPWDSKYFTKASEMFFKMFRDTVTCTPPKFSDGTNLQSANTHEAQDGFLGQHQMRQKEMKNNNSHSEPTSNHKLVSLPQSKKNTSDPTKPKDGTNSTGHNVDKSTIKTVHHRKTSPGKINIRFEKSLDVKCKMHPEASTKTSDMCENVTFHVSTRNSPPNYQVSPKEDVPKNSKKEQVVSFDKLYEESSTVPTIIVGAKSDIWRSSGNGENVREKSVPDVLHGAVATSDKGRGDALNKVDFTVCKTPDRSNLGNDGRKIGELSKTKKDGRSDHLKGQMTASMRVPITSKTIKQVSTPYQMESVKIEEPPKPEKSYKWERIVNVFKNIIISDIEGKRPKFLIENTPTVPTISTANIAKPVPMKKLAATTVKKGVSKVQSKSEHAQKRKYETAKKKRPGESKRGHIIKNNPRKIVNYFSKRGASASSYERPRYDEKSYDQPEGLMSQTPASMGQNSSSFASHSK